MSTHPNLYLRIHKALRGFMSDTLVRVGRMDPQDPCEIAETAGEVRELLALCRAHLRHENEFVHPAIEQAMAGASAHIAAEHVAHEHEIESLESMVDALERSADDRSIAAARLHAALGEFIGENFLHMRYEETAHHAVLAAAYTPAQLIDIERRIVASLTPRESEQSLRLFMRYLNAGERAELLRAMKPGVPPQVFGGVLELGRGLLSERDWFKLQASLAA